MFTNLNMGHINSISEVSSYWLDDEFDS